MKNKVSILLIVGISFIVGCAKEQIPAGLILQSAVIDVDTNYLLSTVPSAEPKRLFVEEFTGVRCVNCPAGASLIKSLQTANPNRIYVAKVHSDFLATPVKNTDPDMRCPDAQALDVDVAKLAPKPSASIDRIYNNANSSYAYGLGLWSGLINTQLAKPSPINLGLSVLSFDATSKEVKLQTKATFTSNFADSVTYHIYVLENGIEATQDSSGGVELEEYEHEEVLRDVVTPIGSGAPWLNNISPKVAGLEAIKISTFTLDSKVINPSKCVIMVGIQNGRTKEMIQANEVKLQ